ncbi:uncharacterized protein ACR2FA_004536 isoform 2-T2 [Aphomia sociella]
MKWLILIGFLLSLTSLCCGRVLRCAPDSKDPSCFSEKEEKDKLKLPQGKQCAAGTYWKTQCNVCMCETSGIATCTKVGCENERSMVCAPGSRWMNDCNACSCENGQPICTLQACPTSASKGSSIHKEASLVKEGRECAPGTTWETECNTCMCSPKGYPMCTLNSCPNERQMRCASETFWQNECNSCACNDGQPICTTADCSSAIKTSYIELPEPLPEVTECVPGSSWKTECDDCSCQLNGHALCSNLRCQNDPVVFEESTTKKNIELTNSSQPVKPVISNKTVVCVANRMFIRDCNTCWCNDDGTSFFCTRKVCIPELPDTENNEEKPEELRIIQRECRPNEVFELDCNMCRCNPDGKSFSCTRRACAEHSDDVQNSTLVRKVRDISREPAKACQPGSEFRMDCNKCLCDNEGQDFSCTRIDCNAQNNNNNGGLRSKRDITEKIASDCTPGTVFEKGCNVCRCTGKGEALCTTNKCKDHTEEATNTVQESEVDSNFRCNPGEQFNFECNDCTCSADGKGVFCTLRFCDQSLNPDI